MKLHWSPRSPFVRKVMLFAHETGLVDRLTCVRTVVAMKAPNAALLPDNPLNKIPTLVLDDGSPLYDSGVICEYLDTLHDRPKLFPTEGRARWIALRRQALANGFSISCCSGATSASDRQPSQPLLDAFARNTAPLWQPWSATRRSSSAHHSASGTSPSGAACHISTFALAIWAGATGIRASPRGTRHLPNGLRPRPRKPWRIEWPARCRTFACSI